MNKDWNDLMNENYWRDPWDVEPELDFQFVTKRLAVGGAIGTTKNMMALSVAGITHVVDMQYEFDDRTIVAGGIQVLWIKCHDDFQPKAQEMFLEGVHFTLKALEDPSARVLFHCAQGIHRGPMMLLAVLRALGHGKNRARQAIRAVRPQADFPPVYVASVEEFSVEWRANSPMAVA